MTNINKTESNLEKIEIMKNKKAVETNIIDSDCEAFFDEINDIITDVEAGKFIEGNLETLEKKYKS